ncbi:MAG TPA: TadE family protein [Gemmatimonadaceae bacterium]|jgi:Flp pilus assembly protein TadG|nr:TadE family protein [Gemmatimonadaceae bacterium]
MNAFSRFRKNESGAAMVEFALVFTFLLLPLIIGIMEFGRANWIKSAVTSAAREGTRYAIVHGFDSGALISDTAAISTYINTRARISPLNITTTYPDGNHNPGSRVQVQVSYAYTPVVRLFQASVGGRTVRIPFLTPRNITSTSRQIIAY